MDRTTLGYTKESILRNKEDERPKYRISEVRFEKVEKFQREQDMDQGMGSRVFEQDIRPAPSKTD